MESKSNSKIRKKDCIKAADILIKNGLIVDPYADKEFKSDIFIKEGIIREV
ncbi:MAG: hypothetical protein H5T85_03335, partial [Actinobacteria bacterium]|nr:hypothetical protein [Actinomycetota bacterium]